MRLRAIPERKLPLPHAWDSDDEAVSPENSVLYYLALLKNKVSASLHIYPKGGHSFGFRDNFVYKRQWTDELEKWLSTIE